MSEAKGKTKAAAAAREAEREPSWLRDELPSLLGAVAVALLVRTFLVQTFYVPSESMRPTLLIGDHVFVNKFVYGAQFPGAEWRFPAVREPKRGEVVVFRFARDAGGNPVPHDLLPDAPRDNFVKRMVGLPGDHIVFRDGRLILNGEVVPLEPTGLSYTSELDVAHGVTRDVYIETLGDCRHYVLDQPHYQPPDMPEVDLVVEPGRYFFMGDNRDNSRDGRWAGTVPKSALAGPAGLNYWSWNWNGEWVELLNPLTWWSNLTSDTMRWHRFGTFVECFPPGETPELVGAVEKLE
jgi:signal peptidase I